jgi:hypothetical protein
LWSILLDIDRAIGLNVETHAITGLQDFELSPQHYSHAPKGMRRFGRFRAWARPSGLVIDAVKRVIAGRP